MSEVSSLSQSSPLHVDLPRAYLQVLPAEWDDRDDGIQSRTNVREIHLSAPGMTERTGRERDAPAVRMGAFVIVCGRGQERDLSLAHLLVAASVERLAGLVKVHCHCHPMGDNGAMRKGTARREERLSVRVTRSLKRAIEREAERERRSVADVVVFALEDRFLSTARKGGK